MNIYELFAAVLRYPQADYRAQFSACCQAVPAECAALLNEFAATAEHVTLTEAQEMYTAAFDFNPNCTLELGWHLFGEKYERGMLLVRMRQELRYYGITESNELPDHLTHALQLLAHMDPGRAQDFAGAIVLPALCKLLSAMKGKANPYEPVLRALDLLLRTTFPGLEIEVPAQELPVLQEAEA